MRSSNWVFEVFRVQRQKTFIELDRCRLVVRLLVAETDVVEQITHGFKSNASSNSFAASSKRPA